MIAAQPRLPTDRTVQHTTPAKSPEKKFPLWEIKLVNSATGIPSGVKSTTDVGPT